MSFLSRITRAYIILLVMAALGLIMTASSGCASDPTTHVPETTPVTTSLERGETDGSEPATETTPVTETASPTKNAAATETAPTPDAPGTPTVAAASKDPEAEQTLISSSQTEQTAETEQPETEQPETEQPETEQAETPEYPEFDLTPGT